MTTTQHSKVYGVFFRLPDEGLDLLGLYFLEGEAEAARAAYIDEAVKSFVDEHGNDFSKKEIDEEQEFFTKQTIIQTLPVGLPVAGTGVVVNL